TRSRSGTPFWISIRWPFSPSIRPNVPWKYRPCWRHPVCSACWPRPVVSCHPGRSNRFPPCAAASAAPDPRVPPPRTERKRRNRMAFDIVVIGAGPAGLCFARSLADSGLRVVLVERQGRKVLADPPDDGREIAVTHHSRQLLCDLGLWEHIPERDIGILRDARVLDGDGSRSLLFRHQDAGRDQLGWLVSNHAIRRAAWAGVENLEHTEVMAGT